MTEIIYGKNGVTEVCRAGKRTIHKIYWGRKKQDPFFDLLKGYPLVEMRLGELDSLAGTKEHQGVAAEVTSFEYAELAEVLDPSRFLVLLDEIQDPHNVGAIIRTAHLAGASGLVLLKHRSALVTPAVVKASSGASEYLPIVKVTNLVDTIKFLKTNGYFVFGAGVGGSSLYETDMICPLALVMGREGEGLRRLVSEHCDQIVTIPMEGKIDSYNVSVAGAMMMGEILRKKSEKVPLSS